MADPKIETKPAAEPAAKADAAAAKPEAAKAEIPVAAKAAPAPAEASKPAAEAAPKPVAKAEPKPEAAKPVRRAPAPRPKKAPARRAAAKKKNVNEPKQGAVKMNKQTKEAVENGAFAADQFKAVFGDVNERAKAAMEKSAKLAEELADLTRGNVEAFVASSKAAAKGVETIGQEAAEYGRRSFEEASAAFKGFADVKSATDFFKLQSDFARSAFDSMVAENAKLSETMIKVAGEVAEPITSRYSVAAERVKNLAA